MGGWSKHDHLQNNYNDDDKDYNINISSLGPTICFREPGDNIVIDPLKLKKTNLQSRVIVPESLVTDTDSSLGKYWSYHRQQVSITAVHTSLS